MSKKEHKKPSVKTTKFSRWNIKGQLVEFKEGVELVIGEDVPEDIAKDMVKHGYAKGEAGAEPEETPEQNPADANKADQPVEETK